MVKHGKCDREGCKYAHDKKAVAAAKEEKGTKGAAVNATDPDWTAKAYHKGKKGKGKGKGKEKGWPGKGGNAAGEPSKKHILCKYI